MAAYLGDRVIGICDSPVGLGRRVTDALGVAPERVRLDYAGLNHLGRLLGVHLDDRDLLPGLLADPTTLGAIEEGRLVGPVWLAALGAVPNEYLHHYYSNRETVAAARAAAQTRGEFLRAQQERCYALLKDPARGALSDWDGARLERETTYVAENRSAAGAGERDMRSAGGYEDVALALMRALARDEPTTLILNVRNRGAIPTLDDDAVVEVPYTVDGAGARPDRVAALPDHALGLVTAVKASERAVLHAASSGSGRVRVAGLRHASAGRLGGRGGPTARGVPAGVPRVGLPHPRSSGSNCWPWRLISGR